MSELDELAKLEVGKSGSKYVFVSVNGKVVSAHLLPVDMVISLAQAMHFDSDTIVIEDYNGIVWENEASRAEQRRLEALEDSPIS